VHPHLLYSASSPVLLMKQYESNQFRRQQSLLKMISSVRMAPFLQSWLPMNTSLHSLTVI